MSIGEAIARLEACRAAAVEAAQLDPDWATDNVPAEAPMRVTPFDVNVAFSAGVDVVAFDVALELLHLVLERRRDVPLIDGEWTPGGNQAIGA